MVPWFPGAPRVRCCNFPEESCFSLRFSAPRSRLTSTACSTAPSTSPSAGPTLTGCSPSSRPATTATTASGSPNRTAEILARAVWWGFPDGDRPLALDCLWVHPSVPDRVELAAELLRHAHEKYGDAPAYHVFVATGWRRPPGGLGRHRLAVGGRGAGRADRRARTARYAWTPARPVPEASGRLVFRAEADDEVFVEVFSRVAVGSLDHHTRQALATRPPRRRPVRMSPTTGACRATGPGGAWPTPRTATSRVRLPSANTPGPWSATWAWCPNTAATATPTTCSARSPGCTPAGRERIAADTDAGNLPMARAFERSGYRVFAVG